jgi:hypothetical protein
LFSLLLVVAIRFDGETVEGQSGVEPHDDFLKCKNVTLALDFGALLDELVQERRACGDPQRDVGLHLNFVLASLDNFKGVHLLGF